jgi:hypothetical protein
VLKDVIGVEAPAPARKTIDLEGRLVKNTVRKTLQDRQKALADWLTRFVNIGNWPMSH